MPTVDPQQVAWISAGAALLGALIGSVGGVASQYIAQVLIEGRELKARTRREARTLEAFRGLLRTHRALARNYRENSIAPTTAALNTTLQPLRTAIQDPTLFLDLEPMQIDSLYLVIQRSDAIILTNSQGLEGTMEEVASLAKECDVAATALGF